MLRTAFTAAIIPAPGLVAAPAFAAGAEPVSRAEHAFAWCQRRPPLLQSRKGSIVPPQKCRQIARAETAQYSPKLPLASRDVGID